MRIPFDKSKGWEVGFFSFHNLDKGNIEKGWPFHIEVCICLYNTGERSKPEKKDNNKVTRVVTRQRSSPRGNQIKIATFPKCHSKFMVKNYGLSWKVFSQGILIKRKRRRSDPVLWQNPLYQQKIRKPKDNTQTPPKTSITQRLRTDLGRSVGVTSHPTGVVKPVYGYPTFPLTAKAV